MECRDVDRQLGDGGEEDCLVSLASTLDCEDHYQQEKEEEEEKEEEDEEEEDEEKQKGKRR